jgi:hypothetical protein
LVYNLINKNPHGDITQDERFAIILDYNSLNSGENYAAILPLENITINDIY